ncbi:MAG: hypothetical protein OEV36_12630 [Myxococcales bacterium]|nr:hypothetical protein [Myxococcales bacterium]
MLVPRQRAIAYLVRIKKQAEQPSSSRLRRILFAGQHQDDVWARWAERSDEPSDQEFEVIFIGDIREIAEFVEGPAFDGERKRKHSACPPERDWRLVDNPPAETINLNRPPKGVNKVDVDRPDAFRNTQSNVPLGSLEQCDRPQDVECISQSLTACRSSVSTPVAPGQPQPESPRPDSEDLAMRARLRRLDKGVGRPSRIMNKLAGLTRGDHEFIGLRTLRSGHDSDSRSR